ncbi:heterokaryon incompatibility protein domain-containing protein [Neurospora intermedia]|uniref:Heterokaryon incompatibility protein domain-containing protein n=1 Tax=Neurospora intermedia TaxID=5142 RepID=A0ABR3DJT5_NEUIN
MAVLQTATPRRVFSSAVEAAYRIYPNHHPRPLSFFFSKKVHQPPSIANHVDLTRALGSRLGTRNRPFKRKKHVNQNLHLALLALRQPNQDRLLWIDAICIDQDNHKEKGHQVGRMRQIYENAEQVLIWLGPSSCEIDSLLDWVRRWDFDTRQRPEAHIAKGWIDSWIRLTNLETVFHGDWIVASWHSALQDILTRSWFRRVWILQEVASAKRATILCGSKAIPSRGFSLLPFLLKVELDSHTEAVLDIFPGYRRKETWWGKTQNLETLLQKFGTSEATDHRDKIYALLGISSDARASNILRPDYEVSLRRAICHTISFLLFGEAYDPPARLLPEYLGFATFLRTLPKLPDYILGWALQTSHDDVAEIWALHKSYDITAAAVVPKAVDINQYYRLSDLGPVTRLSPLGLTIGKPKLDNTFRAILARHDIDIVLFTLQLCTSKVERFTVTYEKTQRGGHGRELCPMCGKRLHLGHEALEDYTFEQLKHILQHPNAGKGKVKDLQLLFHYAALTSQPRIWELLFEVTHCIDLEISIDRLTKASPDWMGDVPNCTHHSTAVYGWFDDADKWAIKFIRLMDFWFHTGLNSLDLPQFAGLAELFAHVAPVSSEKSPDYLVKIIAAWRLMRKGKRLFTDTDDSLVLNLYTKWHSRLLSIRRGPERKSSDWVRRGAEEWAESRLISKQLLSQVPGRFVGEVDVVPSKEPNPVWKLGTLLGWIRGNWIRP